MTKIAVCCGTPMISTFMFRGAEWYCRRCRKELPLLNASRVDSTPELEAESEQNAAWFREVAKDCIPSGSRRSDCEKCEAGTYHLDHATDEALMKSKLAYDALRRF